jgi:hypothetical protein
MELQAHLRSHLELKEKGGGFAKVGRRMNFSRKLLGSLETVEGERQTTLKERKKKIAAQVRSWKRI